MDRIRGGNVIRYLRYFTFPWKVFLHRKKYDCILGWQQFYAINFAFYCRLFQVRKTNKVVALNFTYKRVKEDFQENFMTAICALLYAAII